jgi:hypothetical protein
MACGALQMSIDCHFGAPSGGMGGPLVSVFWTAAINHT